MRKFILPFIALSGLLLGCLLVYLSLRQLPPPEIPFQPPISPYTTYVAGAGAVEANTENIIIGTPFSEVVEEVYVEAGQYVAAGDPLFRLDTRELKSLLKETEENIQIELASYNRMIHEPRPEEIPSLFAVLRQRQVEYEDQSTQFQLYQDVKDSKAYSQNEFNQRRYATQLARYRTDQAESDLELLLAGAWIMDLAISSAKVDQAKAKKTTIETEMERSIIRAPVDGHILQLKARVGELAEKRSEEERPLLIMGNISPLHIRVDVDEEDAWRIQKGAPATAFVRGNSSLSYQLEFVSIEPYIIPKQSFTGEVMERVDTRVLQVIYRFNEDKPHVYVGQIMDVFLQAPPAKAKS